MTATPDNLNLNTTECLVRTYEFGSTTIHNICAGTVSSVHWGALDWVIYGGFAGFLLLIILFLASMLIGSLLDRF